MAAVARSAWTNMKFKFAPTKTIEAFSSRWNTGAYFQVSIFETESTAVHHHQPRWRRAVLSFGIR